MTEAERLAAMTDDEWLAHEQEMRQRAHAGFVGTDIRATLARLWESAERVPVWQRRALEQEFLADLSSSILRVSSRSEEWEPLPEYASDGLPQVVRWVRKDDA